MLHRGDLELPDDAFWNHPWCIHAGCVAATEGQGDIRTASARLMNYYKKFLVLLRLVAAGCLLVGALDLTAYWLKSRREQQPIKPLQCVLDSIPLVIGIGILIKSPAWAQRLTDYLDE